MATPNAPTGPSGAADERTPDDVDADVTLDDNVDDEQAQRQARSPAQLDTDSPDRLAGPFGQPVHPDALVGDEGGTGHYGKQISHDDDKSKD